MAGMTINIKVNPIAVKVVILLLKAAEFLRIRAEIELYDIKLIKPFWSGKKSLYFFVIPKLRIKWLG